MGVPFYLEPKLFPRGHMSARARGIAATRPPPIDIARFLRPFLAGFVAGALCVLALLEFAVHSDKGGLETCHGDGTQECLSV